MNDPPFICPHHLPVRPGEVFTLDQCRPCWIQWGGDYRKPVDNLTRPCSASVGIRFRIRPCHARHPSVEHNPNCPLCQRWESDNKFREAWENFRGNVDLVPCTHRGPLVPLTERYKYNLGTLRDWYPCKKGFGENGFVCPCGGCNNLCTGYDPPANPSTVED